MNIRQSFRIIFRNKTYSILNILGLTIGITSATLIFLWVDNRMSFNHDIPNSKYIYEIGQNQRYGDHINTFFVACGPLSKTLDNEFPEIKRNTRVGGEGNQTFILENENKSFSEFGEYADATIFDMFGMKLIHGNPKTAFEPANPIVISEKMSEKMFAKENPIGKTLKCNDKLYEITGVFKNLSRNITLHFDWLIPFRILEKEYTEKGWVAPENWTSNWMFCYVEIQPTANIDTVNQKLEKLISEKTDGKSDTKLFIYPIEKLLLYNDFVDGKPTGRGYIRTVRMFFYIGLVILAIACINFMNLSTARSQKRALEVGVKKTFGAKQKKLVSQFLGESALITFISLLLAIGLVWLCLPSFNNMVSKHLSLNLFNPVHLTGLLIVGFICTFLAGCYPAFYLSSFSPMSTLKKQKISAGGSVTWIRKGLVVFQFATTFILICATLVVYLQIQHAQTRDLGIKKESLITFEVTPEIINSNAAVQSELQRTGFVESSGLSSQNLLEIWNNGGNYNWQGKAAEANPLISFVYVTPGLIEAAGLELLNGNTFQQGDADSKRSIIINQTLADIMKSEGRVGGQIWQGDDASENYEIKGIVRNFIFNNMYQEKPEPLIIRVSPDVANLLFVRLKPGVNTVEALATIKSVLRKFNSNETFDPTFMDDRFDKMFSGQRLEGKLSALFAGLAIFISCLGLFGLSAYSAEQRTKEIGLRKVMGASVWDILTLLGKSYMVLILSAFVIGIPIGWYIAREYLQNYSYRINLNWTFFAGIAFLVTLIALLTVCSQSLKAATANPIKAIKTE